MFCEHAFKSSKEIVWSIACNVLSVKLSLWLYTNITINFKGSSLVKTFNPTGRLGQTKNSPMKSVFKMHVVSFSNKVLWGTITRTAHTVKCYSISVTYYNHFEVNLSSSTVSVCQTHRVFESTIREALFLFLIIL